ncbi:RNF8, partial [Symbiodinium sp. KB8]
MIERPFDKTQDRCVESSFNDYMENQCWICQDNQSKEFDLWLSCGHIFCSRCSTEMLRRQMPCPLCRTASSSVLRGRSVGPTLLSPGPKSRAEAQSPEKP